MEAPLAPHPVLGGVLFSFSDPVASEVFIAGDFNQWATKVASTDQPFSFMRSIEWELPHWNLGHTFDYAEMAYLIFPRPFIDSAGTVALCG